MTPTDLLDDLDAEAIWNLPSPAPELVPPPVIGHSPQAPVKASRRVGGGGCNWSSCSFPWCC